MKFSRFLQLIVFAAINFLYTSILYATPSTDALYYKDPLTDTNGLTITTGVNQNVGFFSKNSVSPAVIASECITLNQPSGATFQRWGFVDLTTELTTNTIQTLTVETCGGTILSTFTPTANNSLNIQGFNLSSITNPSIRLRWSATGTSTTARLHEWAVYGISTGLISTTLTIPASPLTGNNFNSTLNLGVNGASIPNLTATYNLTALNGTPTVSANSVAAPSSGCIMNGEIEVCGGNVVRANLGLMRDATVCYDLDENGIPGNITNSLASKGIIGNTSTGECLRYRPVQYVGNSNSLAGVAVTGSGTGTNAVDGNIIYAYPVLNSGTVGSSTLTLKLPTGYMNQKGVQTRLLLQYGYSSASGNSSLNTNTSITVNSNQGLSSALQGIISTSHYTASSQAGPSQNIISYSMDNGRSQYEGNLNAGDFEGLEQNIRYDKGSCIPNFVNKAINPIIANYNWPRQQLPLITAGTSTNGIIFKGKYFRSIVEGQSEINYTIQVDPSCSVGSKIRAEALDTVANATIQQGFLFREWNIVFDVCHTGAVIARRASSGLYYFNEGWPGWPTMYDVRGGATRPGEYFISWNPYGNESNRRQTIQLDRTYFLSNITPELTFHGYRSFGFVQGGTSGIMGAIFKDPTGTAPLPTDPTFSHTFDLATGVPAPGWYRMQYQATPYTQYTGTSTDDTNPLAIVKSPGRILIIKSPDNPAGGGAVDDGNFAPDAVWRVCDGTYNCATPIISSSYSTGGGSIYTYQTQSVPFIRSCNNFGGSGYYVGNISYPKIYTSTTSNLVGAGNSFSLYIQPENRNSASEYTNVKWAVDLSSIASSIDLSNVSGEVFLPNGVGGTLIPSTGTFAGQNNGSNCNISNIIFRGPGSDPSNPNLVWWDVPTACQIPNGMGRTNIENTNTYRQVYQFKLNIPVKNTTLPGTVLTPTAQVMDYTGTDTSGVPTVIGAKNGATVARWPLSNYSASSSVTVTENPLISGNKTAPNSWPNDNSVFKYVLTVKNEGNTPLRGWYMVDQLPKNGVNGSTFSPVLGKLYASGDTLLEYSNDGNCFDNGGLSATWLNLPTTTTTAVGYTLETQNIIPTTANCIRARRNTTDLAVAGQIQIAMDTSFAINTPAPGSVYNRAQTGASSTLGGTITLAAVQTALYRTDINNQFVITTAKSGQPSLDIDANTVGNNLGLVDWKIMVQNSSGVAMGTNTAIISDVLPSELTYQGNKTALPVNVSCTDGVNGTDLNNDGIADCNLYSSNEVRYTVTGLTADDSTANSGGDQKIIEIYTVVNPTTPNNTTITNTANSVVPLGGFGLNSTATIKKFGLIMSKTQKIYQADGVTEINRSVSAPNPMNIFPGEKVTYTISVTNNDTLPHYIRFKDIFANWLRLVPGTIRLGNATLSDGFMTTTSNTQYPNQLQYVTVDSVAGGATVVLSLQMEVENPGGAPINEFKNKVYASLCDDRVNLSSCGVSQNISVVNPLMRLMNPKISKTFTPNNTNTNPLTVGQVAQVNMTIFPDTQESNPRVLNNFVVSETLSTGLNFAPQVNLSGSCLSAPFNGVLDSTTPLSSLPNPATRTMKIRFAELSVNNGACDLQFNVVGSVAGSFNNGGAVGQNNITLSSTEATMHAPIAVYTTESGTVIPTIQYVASIDLTVEKKLGSGINNFVVGQVGRYEMRVKNEGQGTSSQMITVTDVLASGLEYVSATGNNWSCNYNATNRTVTCTYSNPLISGSVTEPILLDVQVLPSSQTQISNTAQVSSNEEIVEKQSNNISVVLATVLQSGQVAPLLLKTENVSTLPGQSVWLSHDVVANTTAGIARFSIDLIDNSNQNISNATGYVKTMYHDVNCNETYESGTDILLPELTGSVTLAGGDKKCVLVKVFVPQGVSSSTLIQAIVNMEYTNTSGVAGTPAIYTANNKNLIRVDGEQGLRLTKLVRNVSQNGSFTNNNQAKPNEQLEYQIIYENVSQKPLNNLKVNDRTPNYTNYISARCGSPLGNGLLTCNVNKQPAVGGQGEIEWSTTGSLNSGGNGSVFFNVNVQ